MTLRATCQTPSFGALSLIAGAADVPSLNPARTLTLFDGLVRNYGEVRFTTRT